MKKRIKNGFTLIELIIFTGIFSVLIFMMTDIFVTSLETKSAGEANAVVNQDARFILTKITNDLNNANQIVSPELENSSTSLNFIKYGVSNQYSLSNGNLILTQNLQTHVLNSTNSMIREINFTHLGNEGGKSAVKINLTVESRFSVNGDPEIISLETVIGLR